MKKLDNQASVYPVIIFFICIALAGFLVLLFGEVLMPFFQLGMSTDSTIAANVSQARGYTMSLLTYLWPKGVLLGVLLGLIFWLLMTMQKSRYKDV